MRLKMMLQMVLKAMTLCTSISKTIDRLLLITFNFSLWYLNDRNIFSYHIKRTRGLLSVLRSRRKCLFAVTWPRLNFGSKKKVMFGKKNQRGKKCGLMGLCEGQSLSSAMSVSDIYQNVANPKNLQQFFTYKRCKTVILFQESNTRLIWKSQVWWKYVFGTGFWAPDEPASAILFTLGNHRWPCFDI